MRLLTTLLVVAFTLSLTPAAEIPSYSICNQATANITSARGHITSPNYPKQYPPNRNCALSVVSPKEAGLRLTIEHLDNKEVYDSGTGICHDKLRIASERDGRKPKYLHDDDELCAKHISELRKKTFEILNSGKGVVIAQIDFKTDYDDQATGFSILFEALCNHTQTAESGTITSPNYPANYPNNANCYTEIRAPYGTTILIKFDEFEVDRQLECKTDYVVVSEGSPGLYGVKRKKYCSSDIGSLSINSHVATIQFVSDGTGALSGFSATWTAVRPTTTTTTRTVEATTVQIKNCSHTNESILCQRWDVTSPHKPNYIPGDSNHNFCRNPDDDERGSWCYTTHPEKRRGYCDMSTCVPVTQSTATTVPTTATQPDTPTTVHAFTASFPTTTKIDDSTTDAEHVGAVFVGNPSVGKQTSEDDTSSVGIPWYAIVIAACVLLAIIILVLVFVLKRRRARKTSVTISEPITIDTVAFSQLDRDNNGERPRENTYVEIPFLGGLDESTPMRGADQDAQDTCGKGFVHLNEAQSKKSSVSSLDSMKLAKEAAQRRFMSDRGASTSSDANPYSLADDVRVVGAPQFPDSRTGGSSRTATQPAGGFDNVYHSIETQEGNFFAGIPLPPPPVEKEDTPLTKASNRKKSEDQKLLKKSSKGSLIPSTGFSNPSFKERDDRNVFSSDDENPFDTDDEGTVKQATSYQLSPGNPFRDDSTREKDEYNLYNMPSVIPSPEQSTLKVEEEKKHSSADSPYMMPKIHMPSKVPDDAKMICISPELIDDKQINAFENDFVEYSSPANPTSPVFDLDTDGNFTYAAPREIRAAGSVSSKSDSDGSAKSARDSGNSSLSAIELISDDKQEYCVMGSIKNLNRRDKKAVSESHTLEENRLSQLYLSMKGIQTDIGASKVSGKALQNQASKPRQSL